jgi:hypothetical protein
VSELTCSGRGRHCCQATGNVYQHQPPGSAVEDALACFDWWLAWYAKLPWWQRILPR